jgi:hypothetical protein
VEAAGERPHGELRQRHAEPDSIDEDMRGRIRVVDAKLPVDADDAERQARQQPARRRSLQRRRGEVFPGLSCLLGHAVLSRHPGLP